MRLQKARPLGELRRKAVRGHNVRSKTLSVTQACHLSQSERLFEISIFRWDIIVGAIHESPEIQLTEYGKIVDRLINAVSSQSLAIIDKYVIMPNHIHLIIIIADSEELRAIRESPLQNRSVISKIIGYIKMNASKEIHNISGNETVWQRGFHDHIIRNQSDYDKISKYIYENPIVWQYDCFYTED